jgi:ADP-ribose pyrophosphatase YjhB (NUDIX family)
VQQRRNKRDTPELLPQVTKGWLSIRLRCAQTGSILTNFHRFLSNLLLTIKGCVNPVVFGVTGAIRDKQGRVLLVRQGYMPGWRLPGGGPGWGEPPEMAVRRELHEEVGLRGGAARLFGLYSRKAGFLTHVTALYVIEGGAVDFRPGWEVREIVWAAPDAPPPGTAASTLRRLAELAAGAQQRLDW